MTTKACKTVISKDLIPKERATAFFEYIRDNYQWGAGIPSKKGFTRKAASCRTGLDPEIDTLIAECLSALTTRTYTVIGYYLNYYENGGMWTPNHSHKGTHQLVISLGATRTFTIGKKEFSMGNGDVALFGSAVHGIPIDNSVHTGRISIATFMIPLD